MPFMQALDSKRTVRSASFLSSPMDVQASQGTPPRHGMQASQGMEVRVGPLTGSLSTLAIHLAPAQTSLNEPRASLSQQDVHPSPRKL